MHHHPSHRTSIQIPILRRTIATASRWMLWLSQVNWLKPCNSFQCQHSREITTILKMIMKTSNWIRISLFVMEQMEAPFSSIVSTLCSRNFSSSPGIEIGTIPVRLIWLMEAVHVTHHVLVDVKPENFMLASTSASASNLKKKSISTSVINISNSNIGRR